MSQGRAAFCGSPKSSVAYFNDIGHPVPNLSNPADHVLSVINHEFTDHAQVTSVLEAWAAKGSLVSKHSAGKHLIFGGLDLFTMDMLSNAWWLT